MSPNPLDVQTIHASQNDGEARQWEFELHNNGELIDTSDVKEQMVFKSYKGGTEELLPSGLLNGSVDLGSLTWEYQSEYTRFRASFTGFKPSASQYVSGNILCAKYTTGSMQETQTVNNVIAIGASGINYVYIKDTSYTDATAFKESLQGVYLWYETTDSTPTTSPFKGDIRYPQGLLTDQEFTYRQSPTEEDGLAFVERIKGNTLNWNQLVPTANKDFTSTDTDTRSLLLICRQSVSPYTELLNKNNVSVGILTAILQPAFTGSIQIIHSGRQRNFNILTSNIVSVVSGHKYLLSMNVVGADTSVVGGVSTKDLMIFDLTQIGLDSITDPSEFTSLFPLPFYDFNQGTLIPFSGNGIKTVGFNQWDEEWELGTYLNINGSKYNSTTKIRNVNPIRVMPNTSYYYMVGTTSTDEDGVFFYDGNMAFIRRQPISHGSSVSTSFTTPANCMYMNFSVKHTTYNNDICINISDTERNGEYEPYTSSTLSLPISTYFPTGMKSAGNVFDELTESKAITRIGAVDLGSLNWVYLTSGSVLAPYFYASFNEIKSQGNPARNKANIICSKYQNVIRDPAYFVDRTICADGSPTVLTQIQIKDSSYTDATAFKTAMSGFYLYYEMVTETETSFTTASLVTENAEIPLSNDDGVLLGKCTEELSEEPGFHDAKIKLADGDGECYSNKIQLHIERSPQ